MVKDFVSNFITDIFFVPATNDPDYESLFCITYDLRVRWQCL